MNNIYRHFTNSPLTVCSFFWCCCGLLATNENNRSPCACSNDQNYNADCEWNRARPRLSCAPE